jgi:hypothetical protein
MEVGGGDYWGVFSLLLWKFGIRVSKLLSRKSFKIICSPKIEQKAKAGMNTRMDQSQSVSKPWGKIYDL